MAISINNMVASLTVGNLLDNTTKDLGESFKRLTTGLRVNSSADGGGALSVAMHLSSKVSGLAVVRDNVNDNLSMAQVADAALSETVGALQEIRDLAVDASTTTKSASDRTALNNEINALISEISRIATETELYDQSLLTGDFTTTVMTSPDVGNTLTMTIAGASLQKLALGLSGSKLNVSTAGTTSAGIATSRAIIAADAALDSVAAIRGSLGGMQNRFESVIGIIDSSSLAYSGAYSRVMDVNVADETADMARNSILQKAGVAVMAQANLQPGVLLKLLEPS